MELSRQECWSGLPFPSPGDLPDPAIKPGPPELQVESLSSEPPRRLSNRNSNKTAQDGWLGQPLAVPLTRSSGDNGQKNSHGDSRVPHLTCLRPSPLQFPPEQFFPLPSQSFVCTVKPLPALTTCPSYSASSTPPLPREAESRT